jgi:glycosyltransferase involved in cell wall biosynthesis
MRLHVNYNTTEGPWGGVNSFIRGFKEYIADNRPDVKLVGSIYDCPDIVLLCAAQAGAGQEISVPRIKRQVEFRNGRIGRLACRGRRAKVVHRLDGLRATYGGAFVDNDRLQLELAQHADWIVFQSAASREHFGRFGVAGDQHTIVYNGVNQEVFNLDGKKIRDIRTANTIKVVAASWSTNVNKGFGVVSEFSLLPNVEVTFVGRWNTDIDPGNVTLLPPLDHRGLADVFKGSDIFLHAAENDPCPNVVLEALSCGLPVIYHDSGGTKELATSYGLPLPAAITLGGLNALLTKMRTQHAAYLERIISNRKSFSVARAADEYIDLFYEILGGSHK